MFITGASRGIGKAVGIKAAKDGANVVIAAKTVEKHAKLDGTIYTAAEEGNTYIELNNFFQYCRYHKLPPLDSTVLPLIHI